MEKREYYRKLIEEQESSGKGVKEFCVEQGIVVARFFYWRIKIKRSAAPQFRRVELQSKACSQVEMELSSGIKLKVKISELKAVVDALS